MEYVTTKSRILASLRRSKRGLTAQELCSKMDTNRNSVYATISTLKKEGHNIVASQTRDGLNRYSIPST